MPWTWSGKSGPRIKVMRNWPSPKVINGIFHGGKNLSAPESLLRFVNFACDQDERLTRVLSLTTRRGVADSGFSSLSLSFPLSMLLILYLETLRVGEGRRESFVCFISVRRSRDKLSISTRPVRSARKEKPQR